jgi:hypothetical protein
MTRTEAAIRAFQGPHNAPLRRRIREALESAEPASVLHLRRTIALTPEGEAKLHAVWAAWQADNPIVGR